MQRAVLAFIIAGIIVAGVGDARAETYAAYQVRAVVPCPSITNPPSADDATTLITCLNDLDDFGHGKAYRSVVSGVQVGTPRAYAYGDPGGNEINPNAPVYPIRGQHVRYVCSPVSDYMKNAGKNCTAITYSGLGICYQTTFSDWKCVLNGNRTGTDDNVPGPQ